MRARRILALVAGLGLRACRWPTVDAPSATAATARTAAALAATPPAADRMPGDVPTKKTPWVLDGEVTKIVQVGNTMIAGGLFTQVADPMNGTPYTRQNLFAFDATTGLVSQTFNPTVDGQVQQLLPGPTRRHRLRRRRLHQDQRQGPQPPPAAQHQHRPGGARRSRRRRTNGGIETMELLPGNRLFIGGFFTKIGGVDHGQLATLNATTGALDPFMDITVAGHHNNSGAGAQAPIGPRESGRHPGR